MKRGIYQKIEWIMMGVLLVSLLVVALLTIWEGSGEGLPELLMLLAIAAALIIPLYIQPSILREQARRRREAIAKVLTKEIKSCGSTALGHAQVLAGACFHDNQVDLLGGIAARFLLRPPDTLVWESCLNDPIVIQGEHMEHVFDFYSAVMRMNFFIGAFQRRHPDIWALLHSMSEGGMDGLSQREKDLIVDQVFLASRLVQICGMIAAAHDLENLEDLRKKFFLRDVKVPAWLTAWLEGFLPGARVVCP